MINKKLKITAIVIGIGSLLYSAYSIWVIKMLISLGGQFDIRMLTGNAIFTYLLLSPLSTIGLFVATLGLYKGRKWGHILSNICLITFLGGFAIVLTHHFFPELIDSTVQTKSGWFVFYHMNLNLETLAAPTLVTMLLILLNIKSIRRVYH